MIFQNKDPHPSPTHPLQPPIQALKVFYGNISAELVKTYPGYVIVRLQLDLYPSTDSSGQSAPDQMGEEPVNIVFARTIDQFVRDDISICDATVPGFRLAPDSTTESWQRR
jgi:hypothetical protein